MLGKILLPAALGAAAVAALVPSAASAQSFGIYVGSGYPRYYDDDRREAWIAHERWEQRQEWAREQARRRYWQHERWEQERARRDWDRERWNRERWEHQRDWRGDDDDD